MIVVQHKRDMTFSLSNARVRPPTRTASGKHGCMLTRSLDLPPYWDKPHTSQEFNLSRLCSPELRAFAVVRYVSVALVTSQHASHTRNALRRERIARAYPMLPCFVVIRVLDCVRCVGQHGTFSRVFFATCTHQFTIHPIIDKTYPTHISDGAPRAGKRQGRVARSAMSCSFRFAARPTSCHVMPRFRTRYRAAPTRTAHQGHVARTSARCYTRRRARTRYSQRALIRVATLTKYRLIFREPYQAHASHEAARIGSSRVSVFVSVLCFWCGFHRQMSRRCPFFSLPKFR